MSVDHALWLWIVTHRLAVLSPLMSFVSFIGRGAFVWLIAGAVLTIARRMRRSELLRLALSILLASTLADQALKPLMHRERPYVSTPQIQILDELPDDASFPSGHAASAFAALYVLSRVVPAGRLVWWGLALAIAYSRVYVGVHYPLDVIGGAILGWCCGMLVDRAIGAIISRQAKSAT
jgi:undecaprenyl-diphosphatase